MATIRLRTTNLTRLRRGHPWVYATEIAGVEGDLADGDLVEIRDHRDRGLGCGFFSATSRIAVRRLDTRALVVPDAGFFRQRIAAAWDHRRRVLADASCCRVVSSEADFLPGLIVDRYDDRCVLQTLTRGMDARLPLIADAVGAVLEPSVIVERNDAPARRLEGLELRRSMLAGDEREAVGEILLDGLLLEVDLLRGHKSGLYLDQRTNHSRIAALASGRRVLDAFSYQGGFALGCAASGAAHVTAVESSDTAVEALQRNVRRNGLEGTVEVVRENVFDYLKRTDAAREGRAAPFDLIVLDPPSFTRSRRTVREALRGYKEIHLRACRLLSSGGLLATFCCSHHVDRPTFEEVAVAAATDARRTLRRLASLGQAPDHPVLPAVPETEYLKGFVFDVLGG